MEDTTIAFKTKTAVFMASPFRSRIILNSLFMTFFSFVVFPLITNESEPQCAMLAIIPSAIATLTLWFTFINKYVD